MKTLVVALEQHVLDALIQARALSLDDFRCMSTETKEYVRSSFLRAAKMQQREKERQHKDLMPSH